MLVDWPIVCGKESTMKKYDKKFTLTCTFSGYAMKARA